MSKTTVRIASLISVLFFLLPFSAAQAQTQNDNVAPPDSPSNASARRQYASALQRSMTRSLQSNPKVDPTLVSLRVHTSTPKASRGVQTREDYRLEVETNSVDLPRDITPLLRNKRFNGDLYKLGFREVSFQDTVGEQMGTVMCAVKLKPEGAHPAFCMKMGSVTYAGGDYGQGVQGAGWNEFHRWPQDYIVH